MTYLDAVMASVPRDYWKLDEFGSTVTALNTTGTVVGHYIAAPTLTVPGPLKLEDDSAVSFNAPDVQFVDISGASIVSLTQFSVEFWVKGASQSGAVVYSETSSSGSALFTFACSATNKLVVTIVDDSAATKLALTSTATVFDGNWHHVVFTSDVGLYRLYVDAVQSNTSTYTPGTLTINASALATEIHDAGNLNYFTGSIDEVATYASILSAADVAVHYRAAFTTFVMVDALLKKPNITYSVQVDAKLKKRLSVAVDALLVNPAGTFRGTGTTAERDALVALQAKDTWINTEAKQQQYWTGSAWLSAGSIASPSSGQDQNIMAPTTAGWRAEMGDATYPIRYWNGTTAKFTVDNAGNVIAVGTVTAGSFIGGSIDIPSVGGTGFHVASTGESSWGGTNAGGGTLHVDPASGDVNSAGTFTLTGSTGAFRTASSGFRIEMSRSGALYERIKFYDGTNTVSPNYIQVQGGASSTSVVVAAGATDVGVSPPSLFGARVSVINDTTSSWVYAQADRHVWHGSAADAEWNALGGYLNVGSASTPAAPSSNDVRVWDSSGTLKWKNATTTYDLSKTLDILTTKGDIVSFSTVPARLGVGSNTQVLTADSTTATGLKWAAAAGSTTMATDTLWDALGDLVYGSGADTGAKLAGNTTTTKQFLSQTGNGTISAAPTWSTIDLSTSSVTGILAAARFPALTGDVTTSSGAVATTIANNAVSYAKMQDVSATSRFLGRITAGAGDPEELTAANAKTILALQASDLSDNANLAKLNAGNTFTVTPQTLTIDAAGHVGLQINLAASQTARAIQVTDSDGVQAFQMAGSGADILISQYAASPQISGRRAEGTNLLPTAVAADSIGLGLGFRGYGTSFASQDKANIALTAAELWSATAQGTYIDFTTTLKGGTTRTAYFRMTDDGAFRFKEVAAPANPASGFGLIYQGTDSMPHIINDTPTNFNIGTSTSTPVTTDATAASAGTVTNAHAADNHRHDLGAHGDASHTDTTRATQWYSVDNFTLDSGTGATLGAVPTAVAAVALADAATQGFYFDIRTPDDWASGAINAIIYWVPGSTDATSHTVRWRFNVIELVAGTDVTAAATATTWTGASAARTANLLVLESSQAVATPTAANSIIKLNVRRVGADAADTYVGVVNVIGIRLEYTATR